MTNYPPPPPVEPQQPAQPVRPEPPQSVLTAVRLMYAGAVLSLLSAIVVLATMGDIRERVEEADTSGALTGSQLDTAVTIATASVIGGAIVGGLIGAGLWFWMARMNLKGRNWARILSTVFFGLNTLSVLGSLTQAGQNAIGLALNVVVWLVGLGAVIFIWRGENKLFYQPAPQA